MSEDDQSEFLGDEFDPSTFNRAAWGVPRPVEPGADGSWCSQCGMPYSARACGPTHAIQAHLARQGKDLLTELERDTPGS